MRRRGVLVVEVLIAAVVAALAFLTFMTVSRSSYQYAAMSRNRAIAGVMARSLMAEIEAHPYGAQPPPNWAEQDERPVRIWIQGRPTNLVFHKHIKYLNSSFITPGSSLDSDVVTVTIHWQESVGQGREANSSEREMVIEVPVWR